MTMSIALLGGSGQLGRCLINELGEKNINFFAPTRQECDITNIISVNDFLAQKKFTHLINCAAWTDVDGAEDNPDSAFLINADGAKNLALSCSNHSLKLIHISTDYVFDGNSSVPYKTTDATNPATVYGQSKLAGEKFILSIHPEKSWVVRTAWLYSPFGKNFAKAILRKAKKGETLSVINDAWGQPTSATSLARQLLNLLEDDCVPGVYHGTNSGATTWFNFAKEILELAGIETVISPTMSKNYPQRAPRPLHSVLDHSEWNRQGMLEMTTWKIALSEILPEILKTLEREQYEDHTFGN
jgi:dTDP-4-dehydrorhamnose reductase